MTDNAFPQDLQLESLEVGAAPLIHQLLQQLDLATLLQQPLPALPGRQPQVPTPAVLQVLITNLLLARQPLYAIADFARRRVPEHLGLQPEQVSLQGDDRFGRALDHLHRADRASLLTALVLRAVAAFDLDLYEMHQDTTTVTFCGDYADQPPPEQAIRPPRITFGYNKDHRPDLKQLLFSITITDDGAVPVHCKIYDGSTTDDQVHRDSWLFVRAVVGSSDFLYVADSKLCTRENMGWIVDRQGRFLTVMPRTRSEDAWFRCWLLDHEVNWQEVHRQPNPRGLDKPEVVYEAFESPQRSAEGYRILWYRSSQKQQQDCQARQQRLQRARRRLEQLRPVGRGGIFRSYEQAHKAGQRVLQEEQVEHWLHLRVEASFEQSYRQVGPGRPGPGTLHEQVQTMSYQVAVDEDAAALIQAARCDGLFPLMSNDESLTLAEALSKYKYQPFVEKRHEQLKSVFGVTPMWLKNVARIESLLWLYFVVELVQALLEREVRRQMERTDQVSLALCPEGRRSEAPTAALVLSVLEGHRRHRLLVEHGQELRRFHDPLSQVAQQTLALLGVPRTAYGVE
jgi:transposase